MANLDTREKRASGVHVGLPWRWLLPLPDGAITQADRQQAAAWYAGILAAAAVAGWYDAAWLYRRAVTFTEQSGSALTEYAVKVVISGGSFTSAQADGDDFRVTLADGTTLIPHWVESWDSGAGDLTIWARVPSIAASGTVTLYLYYGNAAAVSASDGEEVFLAFSSFSKGASGDQPWGWRTWFIGTPDGGATVDLSATQARSDRPLGSAVLTSVSTGTGSEAPFTARIAQQRQCFVAAGRYWLVWADISGGTPPFPMYYRSSTDGVTWTGDTSLRDSPQRDASWDVAYDGTYVHVAKNIIYALPDPGYGGLEYRVGTPNADGTITWLADWQTALASAVIVTDLNLSIGTDGHAWVCYSDDNASLPAIGDATVIRNDNVDGTWSTTAGFPVVAYAGVGDDAQGVLAPLASGAMYVVGYEWAQDIVAPGFTVTAAGVVAADADATLVAVESASGDNTFVSRIDAAGPGDGTVHVAYQDVNQVVRYRKRSAAGAWGDEVILDTAARVHDWVTSPRVSFDGATGVIVMWTYTSGRAIYWCRSDDSGATWTRPHVLVGMATAEATLEHAMPAEKTAGDGLLPVAYINGSYTLIHALCDVQSPGDAVSLAGRLYKPTATSFVMACDHRTPNVGAAHSFECALYIDTIGGAAANDNFVFGLVTGSGIGLNVSANFGPWVAFYGNPANKIGYYNGSSHTQLADITWDAWHMVSIRIKTIGTFDLYLDGTLIGTDLAFFNASPAYSTLGCIRPSITTTRTATAYFDNVRVRPSVATEPTHGAFGAEEAGLVAAMARIIGGWNRIIGG